MPSVSPKQAKLMAAISNGWKPTHMKSPPSVAVAREYHLADRYASPVMQRRPDFMKPRYG